MISSCSFGWRLGVVRQFRQVALFAKKDNRSGDRFSRRDRGDPRKKYTPNLDELGDISVLNDEDVVVENSEELLKNCNEHINYFIEDRNLSEAEELYDLMIKRGVEPDTITFNTLMKGYARGGNNNRVLELFKEMEEKEVKPDKITFNTAIRSYTSNRDLKEAQTLLAKMKNTEGVEPDVYTFNSMLNVCVAARDLETAQKLIQEMNSSGIKRNRVTVNTMIDTFAECCNKKNAKQYLEESKELIREMVGSGIRTNQQAYNTLLKLCSRGRLTDEAMETLIEMRDNSVRPDVVSYNTVLDGISKNKSLTKEQVLELSSRIIDEMKKDRECPDAITYNSLISVALRVGDLQRADQMFNEMKMLNIFPDSFTFAMMIKCKEKLGNPNDGQAYLNSCLDLLEECENSGMNLSVQGYISLLSACAKASDPDHAWRIWSKTKLDKRKLTVSVYNAMINMCIGAGDLFEAINLFGEMKDTGIFPDYVTYATMIKGHEKLGDAFDGDDYLRPCLDLLEECEQAGIKMYVEGYISLLSACAKASDLGQALKIWDRMKEKKVRPVLSAFNAMINACLSIDKVNKAFDFLDQMKRAGIKPSVVTFGTFMPYFMKSKDIAGAKRIRNEMKMHGVQPNQRVSSMLKALGVE